MNQIKIKCNFKKLNCESKTTMKDFQDILTENYHLFTDSKYLN